jgi:putative NIF3 family GTP cyclohydrolase 1 type 2
VPQSSVPLERIANHLDALLRTSEVPDYPGAMNGIQVDHAGPVTRCAVAVDASVRTIAGATAAGANLLIVHHGLFWSGAQPLRGHFYERVRLLLQHDIAVYASHLPLDLHPTLGNNPLLDIETSTVADRARAIAEQEGGALVAIGVAPGRRTRRWAICTGAGASSDSLREAAAAGVDTLIVGEGPHHTGVEAQELGIAVLYVGHYATETFGVRALGVELERTFGLPWSFVAAPTGL